LSVVQRSDIVQCDTTVSGCRTDLGVGGRAAVYVCRTTGNTAKTTGIVTSCATGDVTLATEGGRGTCSVRSDGVCTVGVTFVSALCDADIIARDRSDSAETVLSVVDVLVTSVLSWVIA